MNAHNRNVRAYNWSMGIAVVTLIISIFVPPVAFITVVAGGYAMGINHANNIYSKYPNV